MFRMKRNYIYLHWPNLTSSSEKENLCDAQETGSVVPLRREVVKYDQCVPEGPDGPT